MKLVCISDTHMQLDKVSIPDGDVLLHSGDLTFSGNIQEISKELHELSKHRARFKNIVLIAGNHDWLFQRNPELAKQMCEDNGLTYLCDSGVTIDGIRFWGSPWQPEFCNWAFNLWRGEQLKEKWDLIPMDTQVLLTHSPPMGILDCVERFNGKICEYEMEHVGCQDLYNRVMELKDLKVHQFGHLHLNHGTIKIGDTTFINASTCTEKYKPTNQPFIVVI